MPIFSDNRSAIINGSSAKLLTILIKGIPKIVRYKPKLGRKKRGIAAKTIQRRRQRNSFFDYHGWL